MTNPLDIILDQLDSLLSQIAPNDREELMSDIRRLIGEKMEKQEAKAWLNLDRLAQRWGCCYANAAMRLHILGALLFRIDYDEGEPYRFVIPYSDHKISRVRDGVVEWDVEAVEELMR